MHTAAEIYLLLHLVECVSNPTLSDPRIDLSIFLIFNSNCTMLMVYCNKLLPGNAVMIRGHGNIKNHLHRLTFIGL